MSDRTRTENRPANPSESQGKISGSEASAHAAPNATDVATSIYERSQIIDGIRRRLLGIALVALLVLGCGPHIPSPAERKQLSSTCEFGTCFECYGRNCTEFCASRERYCDHDSQEYRDGWRVPPPAIPGAPR